MHKRSQKIPSSPALSGIEGIFYISICVRCMISRKNYFFPEKETARTILIDSFCIFQTANSLIIRKEKAPPDAQSREADVGINPQNRKNRLRRAIPTNATTNPPIRREPSNWVPGAKAIPPIAAPAPNSSARSATRSIKADNFLFISLPYYSLFLHRPVSVLQAIKKKADHIMPGPSPRLELRISTRYFVARSHAQAPINKTPPRSATIPVGNVMTACLISQKAPITNKKRASAKNLAPITNLPCPSLPSWRERA